MTVSVELSQGLVDDGKVSVGVPVASAWTMSVAKVEVAVCVALAGMPVTKAKLDLP